MTAEQSKCAHPACSCVPPAGEKYCSAICQDAGANEIEIACECGHPGCA